SGASRVMSPATDSLAALFDDIALRALDEVEHGAPLSGPDLERIERCFDMADEGSPVLLVDAHAAMRGLHVAADIVERSTGRSPPEVDEQLSLAPHAVLAAMQPEAPQPGIGGQPRQEVVDHGHDRVIAAEPRIERVRHLRPLSFPLHEVSQRLSLGA